MTFSGKVARVGTSIGIAWLTTGAASPDDLLKHADAAMYQAKTAGKNTYRFWD